MSLTVPYIPCGLKGWDGQLGHGVDETKGMGWTDVGSPLSTGIKRIPDSL